MPTITVYVPPSVQVTVIDGPPPGTDPPPPFGLVQQANLVLQGSFTANPNVTSAWPGPTDNLYEFSYAVGSIAYNPENDSLFVIGHTYAQHAAEMSIPPYNNWAAMLQPFSDPLEGKMGMIDPDVAANIDSGVTGGLFVHNGKLHLSAFAYYDANINAVASHFARPVALSTTGSVVGALRVGTQSVAFYGGYFAAIPASWQSALGGDVIVGNGPLSIIARASHGPAAFATSLSSMEAGTNPTPAQPLAYYDNDHETLGPYGATIVNPQFNGTTQVHGAVIPVGSRSLLFFGRTGTGLYRYGQGTADQNLDGQLVGAGPDIYCYDPEDLGKGNHAYPYRGYVWAYDLNDLAAVKAGTKQPWEVVPYSTWELPEPQRASGVTYDPATGRIFVSVGGYSTVLTVYVYRVL